MVPSSTGGGRTYDAMARKRHCSRWPTPASTTGGSRRTRASSTSTTRSHALYALADRHPDRHVHNNCSTVDGFFLGAPGDRRGCGRCVSRWGSSSMNPGGSPVFRDRPRRFSRFDDVCAELVPTPEHPSGVLYSAAPGANTCSATDELSTFAKIARRRAGTRAQSARDFPQGSLPRRCSRTCPVWPA